jgi:3-oxoacyl-[acyl-carrier protein] reductase
MDEKPFALVTGGSGDLGSAICRELGRCGYTVGVHFHSREDAASAVAEEIVADSGTAFTLGADLTDTAAADAMVAEAFDRTGRIDVLVNNAGAARDGLFLLMAEKDWDFVIETTLKSLYAVTRPVLRRMISRRTGRIVNVSSLSGVSGLPGQANYAAAKGGVLAFTRALSREAAPFHVLVNAVAPGLIESRMYDSIPPEIRNTLVDVIPLKRPGKPEHVASAVAFLASEGAGYITGHTLFVTGGLY